MKKLIFIIFLIFQINTSVYSLNVEDLSYKVGVEHLLKDGFKIIFSNENRVGEISFILEKKKELYLCKINNFKYIPTNRGCFPFPLNEEPDK